jgi:hypothetical protein
MNVGKVLFGTLPFVLGLTSAYGAVQHGNDPAMSLGMSAFGLAVLIITNVIERR